MSALGDGSLGPKLAAGDSAVDNSEAAQIIAVQVLGLTIVLSGKYFCDNTSNGRPAFYHHRDG